MKRAIKAKVILAMGLCFFLFIGSSFSQDLKISASEREKTYRELELFADALAIVQTQYVEHKSPQELIYGALRGLLASLDPYSQFMDPDEYKELIIDTRGKFGGLGIEISVRDGLLTVISPLADTPAWRAGIKAGDIIVKINGEITKGITLTEAVKKLRGKPGTQVNITVLREGAPKMLNFNITREMIKVKDIKKSALIEGKISYVSISEFRENTASELDKTLADLTKKGMQALVLDLRNNPGGLLMSAVKVTSRFIPTGELIVYTKSAEGKIVKYNSLNSKVKIINVPMVVLVNNGSASGSEILAGCLQDYKRAVIMGIKTFGKASVQSVVPLSDGSALRVTTAKYYTPQGRLIHQKGIQPDISVEERTMEVKASRQEAIFNKIEKPHLRADDFYKKDYQILRAVDLAKGLLIVSHRR
ncbi:MAG: S41 family peptidase [Candidatus Omnitrophica bacterium]|nr:S41 family peptidase [Candidatus Omnitrophota bacterium]